MSRPFVRGVAWLMAFAFLLGVARTGFGRFAPLFEGDSKAYLAANDSLTAVLTNVRTPGYPLFLKCVGSIDRVPLAQFLVHVAACAVFLAGLLRVGYRAWTATWCAGTLVFGRAVFDFGQTILPDALAISVAIATTGCLFAVLSPRPSAAAWCGLIVLTFLCYQMRPAYLFVIPLWPLLALLLDVFLLRRELPLRTNVWRAGLVALATLVPFCAYSTLRWCWVGHWGLVSFGGYNVIGIPGQYLDRELAAELPVEMRPLAEQIIERRASLEVVWPPDNYEHLAQMYNPTIWELAVPAVQELTPNDSIAVNRELADLSLAILMRRPWRYAHSLWVNGYHALSDWLALTVRDQGTRLLALAYLLTHAAWLVRGGTASVESNAPQDVDRRRLELHLVFWTAAAFSAAKILLVILVEPSIGRYITGAMVFCPAAIAVWVSHAVERTVNERNGELVIGH